MKAIIIVLTITGSIAVIWVLLTFWANKQGAKKSWLFTSDNAHLKALIVYDPDPFYNLDEQVCVTFGRKLSECGFRVNVRTVAAITETDTANYDLYVFCANTYNWAPDRALSGFIGRQSLENRNVVAITLGSGSTDFSKKKLEEVISGRNANLIDSKAFWLMRPNDENRMKESNTEVAVSMVATWASEIAKKIGNKDQLSCGLNNPNE